MKKIIFILTVLLVFTSCEDFLDIQPETKFTDDNFWTSEGNLRSFSFGLYGVFYGYGDGGFFGGDHFFSTLSDDVMSLDERSEFDFPNVVPATASGTDWYWGYIRKANVLIEGAKKASVTTSIQEKYIGVGRLFRAIYYWEKVRLYGDVPYYNEPIESTDTDALYKARDSRIVVVDSIVADLDYAIAHLPDVNNTVEVNMYTALALKSRICLAAGTTFKYHNVDAGKATELLQASYDASKALMDAGVFSLHDNYTELFASEDLTGNSEAILVKQYNENMRHSIHSFIFHEPFFGFTLDFLNSFLMTDGTPIYSAPGVPHAGYTEWVFSTPDSIYTAYTSYDVTVDITANRDRRIPAIIDTTRLIFLFNKGIPMYSPSKYATYKLIKEQPTQGVQATTDAPVIRLGEILLNYAEAAFELGTISQGDLDNTINLIRARAGVAPLLMGVADAYDKDADVDALLWEIRRERRIELALEPFRKWDLIRWHKADKLNEDNVFVGVKDDPNNKYESTIEILRNANGYLYSTAPTDRRELFEDKKYLYPIPADQLTLNPNLVQNPGW